MDDLAAKSHWYRSRFARRIALIFILNIDAERIERLESELANLNQRLDIAQLHVDAILSPSLSRSTEFVELNPHRSGSPSSSRAQNLALYQSANVSNGSVANQERPSGSLLDFAVRQRSTIDAVAAGVITESDSEFWFSTFFDGCDRFIPVFDPVADNYDSIRDRSCTLFDIVVIFGVRAAHGALSRQYQTLYGLLRQHTSDLVLRVSGSANSEISLDDIQALLVVASYSDNGAILCDVALSASIQAGLAKRVEGLFAVSAARPIDVSSMDNSAFPVARIWYCLFVLDMILSVDGGKNPSIELRSQPRRVRILLNHPQRTTLDIRLFAQVELNALRSAAHASITAATDRPDMENTIDSTVKGAVVALDLWLSEWQGIVFGDASLGSEHSVMSLNLQIQHAWALLTLHLRSLIASGIENIALMTDRQRSIALAAKDAAEQHLQLLLTDMASAATPDDSGTRASYRPYIANFKYAMEFVWAKNAFCVLIILRLGILLMDPLHHLTARLAEARKFLSELDKIGMGPNAGYTRILTKTVDKCEEAVNSVQQSAGSAVNSAEDDFQSFIPKEFMFEWDFPGLNLCYIPLDWQDLFLDFDAND